MSERASIFYSMCCPDMSYHMNRRCAEHGDACDELIVTRLRDGTIGIIVHDGGGSVIEIRFCPWCGVRLVPSTARAREPGYVDRAANVDIRTPEEHEPR